MEAIRQAIIMTRQMIYVRVGLFILIFSLGIGFAFVVGEREGLALADLTNRPVGAMTQTSGGEVLYTALNDEADRKISRVYRSDDNGRSWQLLGFGPEAAINTLAIHPAHKRTLYAGTAGGTTLADGSLWYSHNEGRTWERYQLNLPLNRQGQLPAVSVLAAIPDQPGFLYVGTAGQGVYRVDMKREGYELVGGAALGDLYVQDIVAGPDGRLYVLTTEKLLVGQGDLWRQIETLPDLAVSLVADPVDSQTLYAGTVAYGAYRSTDAGETWHSLNADLGWQPGILMQISALTLDTEESTHLALATAYGVGNRLAGGGIYESFDAGQSWAKLADSYEMVNDLTIKEGGVYAATAKGLVRYGAPLPPAPLRTRLQLRHLTNPTGIQGGILILTVILAGWVLIGRMRWLQALREIF